MFLKGGILYKEEMVLKSVNKETGQKIYSDCLVGYDKNDNIVSFDYINNEDYESEHR
jgi:hypothetical protein